MDEQRDAFVGGKRLMITAFVEMSDLARKAGVDPDVITGLHGRFFDGNVETKDAFRKVCLLAAIWPREES